MPLRLETPMPSLSAVTEWLNGQPTELNGHPVLVYFWSVSCHICHDNMPRLIVWREHYTQRGLRMVAIHTPRSPEETAMARVQQAMEDFRITDPCGLDNMHAVTEAFENQYVPAYFLFDAEHHLRSRTAGDAGLGLLGDALKRMYPDE